MTRVLQGCSVSRNTFWERAPRSGNRPHDLGTGPSFWEPAPRSGNGPHVLGTGPPFYGVPLHVHTFLCVCTCVRLFACAYVSLRVHVRVSMQVPVSRCVCTFVSTPVHSAVVLIIKHKVARMEACRCVLRIMNQSRVTIIKSNNTDILWISRFM